MLYGRISTLLPANPNVGWLTEGILPPNISFIKAFGSPKLTAMAIAVHLDTFFCTFFFLYVGWCAFCCGFMLSLAPRSSLHIRCMRGASNHLCTAGRKTLHIWQMDGSWGRFLQKWIVRFPFFLCVASRVGFINLFDYFIEHFHACEIASPAYQFPLDFLGFKVATGCQLLGWLTSRPCGSIVKLVRCQVCQNDPLTCRWHFLALIRGWFSSQTWPAPMPSASAPSFPLHLLQHHLQLDQRLPRIQ